MFLHCKIWQPLVNTFTAVGHVISSVTCLTWIMMVPCSYCNCSTGYPDWNFGGFSLSLQTYIRMAS